MLHLPTVLLSLWTWAKLKHPAARLAAEKRRLESVCRAKGCSKSQAAGIAGEFFRRG